MARRFSTMLDCFSGRMKALVTVRNRLGPAWVTCRVVVHQIQVNLDHDGIQLCSSLSVAGEQLVHHALSSNQIMTAERSRARVSGSRLNRLKHR